MSSSKILNNSRLYCYTNYPEKELFFSLVDYRNNYFTSEDSDKIIEFYKGFDNREQLINWMRERPKGSSTIHEVEGEKDIVIVITTADFDGKYAIDCRKSIFKGLHIIFVESGGRGDFYFNYAHNCNVGIRKTMEYNPKWVVVSNDDMYKIDGVEVLKTEIDKVDDDKYDVIFPSPSTYHTIPLYISKKSFTYLIYLYVREKQLGKLYDKYDVNFFGLFYTMKSKVVFRKVKATDFTSTGAFGILSSRYVKRLGLRIFDETYINDHEDLDLSFRFILTDAKSTRIDYEIGTLQGSSLGMGGCRDLRSVAGRAYFNSKYEKLLIKMLGH